MRSIPVSDAIRWVGAIDWNLRDFHGYETPRGTTYNAYLVRGTDKTALVDTVKGRFVDELLARVRSVMDPADVDLIVVNHVEPDHNGGLRRVMRAMPNARVVASRSGVAGVAEYHDGLEVESVGTDDVIDLGGVSLRFLPMPMVHWPDSMFTYCAEERVLMPNDAFGQHMASSERFADEVGLDLAVEELTIYYANILMPLGKQVAKAVEKVVATGWEIETIAPSHGVIWRGETLGPLFDTYARLTAGETREKIVVAFSTMWGSTDTLARAVVDGIAAEGVEVDLFDLAVTPIAHVTRHLLDSRALLLGSPTLHHGMLYRVGGYLQYLSGLKPQGKLGGAFGSYGWSSGATKQISGQLEALGFELPFEPYTQKYRPSAEEVAGAREWGAQYARAVKEMD
ncbi:MAG: FprA family A-type flavoprotein [Anaerosomatales bacterium]|nr:FprA family A-type flavoprotein [Anaerosomatales bacterium]MDT8434120.1 FprA family A-type flavoprotein [Anaerosomatales bacterium]